MYKEHPSVTNKIPIAKTTNFIGNENGITSGEETLNNY